MGIATLRHLPIEQRQSGIMVLTALFPTTNPSTIVEQRSEPDRRPSAYARVGNHYDSPLPLRGDHDRQEEDAVFVAVMHGGHRLPRRKWDLYNLAR